MKIKINPDKKPEEWHVGDVIVNENKQGIALIVKDNDGMYCAMDIDALDHFEWSWWKTIKENENEYQL